MAEVFARLLEMSAVASAVIVVVAVIRLLLRRAPRKYAYALWSVAAFRLVCPVSFRSAFSLFSLAGVKVERTITKALEVPEAPEVLSTPPGMEWEPVVVDPEYVVTIPAVPAPAPEASVITLERVLEIAAVVWLVGLAALLIYGVVSYVRLRRRMATAVHFADRIWQSERVQSPFILGFVRPRIYMPFGLSMEQHRYVLAHEEYHLARLDHIVRPLAFLILAVHWFNPFVWLAYYLMGRDMEMSCDEKVLSEEENISKAYSITLLSFAANRRFPSPSPLAFGESGVKGRIKNVLNWKRPRTWVAVLAVLVCVVVIAGCAADPVEQTDPADTALLADQLEDLTAQGVDAAGFHTTLGTIQLTRQEREAVAGYLRELTADDLTWLEDAEQWYGRGDELRLDIDGFGLSFRDGETALWCVEYKDGSASRQLVWLVDSPELAEFLAELEAAQGWTGTLLPGETADGTELFSMSVDLTHDGQREELIVTGSGWNSQLERWSSLQVVVKQGGQILWTGTAGTDHAAQDGIYLYQRDGKEYLMRWTPYLGGGGCELAYSIFRLDESGDEAVLEEKALSFSVMPVGLLDVDMDALRAFEAEINTLLEDTIVLADTASSNGTPYYSTNQTTLTRLWGGGMADRLSAERETYFAQGPFVYSGVEINDSYLEASVMALVKGKVDLSQQFDGARITLVEELPTGTVGTHGGCFIYRLEYQPFARMGEGAVRWEETVRYYLITNVEYPNASYDEDLMQWDLVAVLTEEAIQSRFNTAELMEIYDDEYQAAVVETVNQWRLARAQ